MTRLLYARGRHALYPMKREMDGSQSQFGHFEEKINPLALPGFMTWIIQPAA
jgi:hypothetical protein